MSTLQVTDQQKQALAQLLAKNGGNKTGFSFTSTSEKPETGFEGKGIADLLSTKNMIGSNQNIQVMNSYIIPLLFSIQRRPEIIGGCTFRCVGLM